MKTKEQIVDEWIQTFNTESQIAKYKKFTTHRDDIISLFDNAKNHSGISENNHWFGFPNPEDTISFLYREIYTVAILPNGNPGPTADAIKRIKYDIEIAIFTPEYASIPINHYPWLEKWKSAKRNNAADRSIVSLPPNNGKKYYQWSCFDFDDIVKINSNKKIWACYKIATECCSCVKVGCRSGKTAASHKTKGKELLANIIW